MKKSLFLFLLLGLQSVFAISNSGFVFEEKFQAPTDYKAWFFGSQLPAGARWVVSPYSFVNSAPESFSGKESIVLESFGGTVSSYFLDATATADFDSETVFLVWAFFESNAESVVFRLHEREAGWKGIAFGEASASGSTRVASFVVPDKGKWVAFLFPVQEFFPGKDFGSIDGFAVELSKGKALVNSFSLLSARSVPERTVPFLSVRLNNTELSKGSLLVVSGSSTEAVALNAVSSNKKVFSATVYPDSNSNFVFQKQVLFDDPSGEWSIFASNGFANISRKVLVVPAEKQGLLNIVFLSPLETSIREGQPVVVSVRIDFNGLPVSDANAFFWGASGERIVLEKAGEGIFSYKYALPFGLDNEKLELFVTASASANGEIFGAEASVPIRVFSVPLVIELVEPKEKYFSFGNPIELKVRAFFPGRKDASIVFVRAKLSHSAGGKNVFDLNHSENDLFETVIPTQFFPDEPVNLQLVVLDSKGREETAVFQLKPRDYWLNFAKTNILFFGFPIVLLLIAVVVWVSELRTTFNETDLFRKKRALEQQMLELEKSYYEGNALQKKEFQSRKAALETQLAETELKLRSMKNKRL